MSQPSSRLFLNPSTQHPSINTFGGLSNFLRHAVADEDSRQFSEGMGLIAAHSESVIRALRLDRNRERMAPLLVDLLTILRDHRQLVLGLGPNWRGCYEYAPYLHALNNFRVLIGQWLLHAEAWSDELEVTAPAFELVAWRTLGEGMLLIDMYEQWRQREESQGSSLGELGERQVERVLQWWHKFKP